MNALMAAGLASRAGSFAGGPSAGDSCALFLLFAAAVSLGIAAYLVYKAPKVPEARVERRPF